MAPSPDLLLVPDLVFDTTGARLGRGKGFYERWLAANPTVRQTSAQARNPCIFFPDLPILPVSIVQGVSEPAISGVDGSGEQPRSLRRFFSNLIIVFIAGGTLTALVLQKEFWPFSHFPMYSVTIDYRKPFKTYHVYGLIEKDGNLTELLLNGSPQLGPFNKGKLMQTLGYAKTTYGGRMWGSYMEISDEFYQRKLRGLLKLYNRNLKKAGNPNTVAPLVGIRLYEVGFSDKLPRPAPLQPSNVHLIAEWREDR